MKKLLVTNPGSIEICEYKTRKLLDDYEVRVEVIIGGICGSDMSVYKGKIPYAVYPLTPGHEIIGRVIETGKNVNFKIGDKVAAYPNTYCGTCENCSNGMTNICSNKKSFGVTIDGLFAEEVVIDSEFLVKVPEEIENKKAVLLEPLAVCVHVISKAEVKSDSKVAVIGCGTEGLLNIAILSFLKADITAIDVNEDKLLKAKEFNENIKTFLPGQITDQKFDIVIEAAGAKKAIEQAFTIVKPGGKLVTLGLTNEEILYPCFLVTRNEITIKGSIIYTKDDFEQALFYLKNKDFNVNPLISEILPFEDYKTAYDDAMSGKKVKVLMEFK